jgi:hypothetical protein
MQEQTILYQQTLALVIPQWPTIRANIPSPRTLVVVLCHHIRECVRQGPRALQRCLLASRNQFADLKIRVIRTALITPQQFCCDWNIKTVDGGPLGAECLEKRNVLADSLQQLVSMFVHLTEAIAANSRFSRIHTIVLVRLR